MREFRYSHEISVLYVYFLTRLLHIVSQAKQSKQLLTKEIRLLLEGTKIYISSKKRENMQFIYLFDESR